MAVQIRPATADDARQIGGLAREFQQYLRALGDQAEFTFGEEAYLRDGFGVRPAFSGLVADMGNPIAGYALFHDGYDTDHGHRLLHLIDLYVQERWRRQGVGRALMQAVAEVGRERGAVAVVWSVYEPNKLAMRFYEGLGAKYVSGLRWMSLRI